MQPIHVIGMYGIGDNIHQLAVIRELVKRHSVWLETCHVWIYQDLVERGDVRLMLRPTSLWMHKRNIEAECSLHPGIYDNKPPPNTPVLRNWYLKPEIDRTGSMLGAMFLACGVAMPDKPNFSLRIRDEWRTDRVHQIVATARASGKPLMVYRPIVLRKEWDSHLRNPDPATYETLYREIRDRFYVVSIASLRPDVEWIVGNEQDADLKIHDGSLEMWEMAALFADADMAFCNAGMGPVLAQATGTPSIVVYGGRESFRTSQRAGVHLAPTLGVNPMNPCDCHSHRHACDKRIDVEAARSRVNGFLQDIAVRHDLCGHAGKVRSATAMV